MSNCFCVNKSGVSMPVYSATDGQTRIGTIYNREAFGYNRNWGGDDYFCNIVFRNSSGNLQRGFLINPPSGGLSYCTSYPYGTVNINGTTYTKFYMRRTQNIYSPSAAFWGNVSVGKCVACLDSVSGDSHPEWKKIYYVQNSSGNWVRVSGTGYTYGFLDTGLSTGSLYSEIPMYGNW